MRYKGGLFARWLVRVATGGIGVFVALWGV